MGWTRGEGDGTLIYTILQGKVNVRDNVPRKASKPPTGPCYRAESESYVECARGPQCFPQPFATAEPIVLGIDFSGRIKNSKSASNCE